MSQYCILVFLSLFLVVPSTQAYTTNFTLQPGVAGGFLICGTSLNPNVCQDMDLSYSIMASPSVYVYLMDYSTWQNWKPRSTPVYYSSLSCSAETTQCQKFWTPLETSPKILGIYNSIFHSNSTVIVTYNTRSTSGSNSALATWAIIVIVISVCLVSLGLCIASCFYCCKERAITMIHNYIRNLAPSRQVADINAYVSMSSPNPIHGDQA